MTDHPSTFKGEDTHREGVQWDDRAEIHSAEDGQGNLDGGKGLRGGTLAQMVAQVMAYPPAAAFKRPETIGSIWLR